MHRSHTHIPAFSASLEAVAGHEITLEGWEAFDAAVHCAAISAGQRMQADREKEHKRKPKAERKVSTPPGGILRRLFSRTSSQQGA